MSYCYLIVDDKQDGDEPWPEEEKSVFKELLGDRYIEPVLSTFSYWVDFYMGADDV